MKTHSEAEDIAAYVARTFALDDLDLLRLAQELLRRSPLAVRNEVLGYLGEAIDNATRNGQQITPP